MTAVSSCQHAWIQEVRNSYTMDANATTLLHALVVRSLQEEGYKLDIGRIKFHDGLWIGDNVVLKTMHIGELHTSTMGIHATYITLKKMFLSGKEVHVEEFVKQCAVCQWAKHEHAHPADTLHPLPVPACVWGKVTMDFIKGISRSNGADIIFMVVGRLSKYAYFIPLHHRFTAP